MGSEKTITLRSRRALVGGELSPHSIIVRAGKIEAVESWHRTEGNVVELGDLILLPGLVDCHVHMNDPGRAEWEGFESATIAAAAGGITTVADMPLNSSPVTIDVPSLMVKEKAGEGKLSVDCCLHGGLVEGSSSNIPLLLAAGVSAIKAFLVHSGIDEFPNASRSDIERAFLLLENSGVPLLVHAELDMPGAEQREIGRSYAAYLASRPDAMETAAIEMLLHALGDKRSKLHIVHVASAKALPLIEAAKAKGALVSAETCPHYLTFAADDIADGATHFKCAPPIRAKPTREALWKALESGVIDMIGSDHSPCPPSMKDPEGGDFGKAWGGISSLQLLLPATWTGARARGLALERLGEWLSLAPARLLGVDHRKGSIEAGKDADLVAFDPDARWTVDPEKLFHRHKLTPYAGMELFGEVHRTFLRGEEIFRDGKIVSPARGVFLKRPADRTGRIA